jgi:hypothetical protein
MKFPETNSRGEAILKAFLKGPMTIYQGAEAHGEFPNRHLPNGINHAKMVELYDSLVERGCLVKEGIVYRITTQARTRLEQKLRGPEEPPSIVPPRVRNFFAKSLFVGYSPMFPWRIAL